MVEDSISTDRFINVCLFFTKQMKCIICKKEGQPIHLKDRIRLWFFNHMFYEERQDLSEDKYTKGFGEGYKIGFQQSKEHQKRLDDLVKFLKKDAK